MSTEKNNQQAIQELEKAKDKLAVLITTLKTNPSLLSDEELKQLSGGFSEVQPGESDSAILDINLVAC